MDFDVERVERHPILQIAIKTIRFFNEDNANVGVLLEMMDQLIEVGAPCLLCGLDIDKFLGDDDRV